jgi:hypothetical protein
MGETAIGNWAKQLSVWQLGKTAIGNWAKHRVANQQLAIGRNSTWQLKMEGATGQHLARS